MKKRITSIGLAGMTAVGVAFAASGTANAATENWRGPHSSHATCVAASGENRGLHAFNVKIPCQLHTTDDQWWYATYI